MAFAYIVFVSGLLIFGAFPKNEYEWMQEIEADMEQLPEDSGSSQLIFTAIILLGILAFQLAVFLKLDLKRDKFIILSLCLLLTITWWIKFRKF